MKYCLNYCGINCVNGNCPKALYNDKFPTYVDIYGTTKRPTCKNCEYYKACEDCYFNNNPEHPCEYCEKEV